jgi:hypothetical protein
MSSKISANRTSNRANFASNRSTPWSSSLPSTDDEYISRMIANTEIIDGTLSPTEVDDREMGETYRELAAQIDEANDGDDESVGGSEEGGACADEEALHGSGWMLWNAVGKL